ncbi:hypothetical protein NP493_1748g00001 [Ridgeia piscesae]|uniref:Uncharacterized protein n=1 Tax=Ridgeia piscesae TaxID=27915 RepID=A0AAD9N6V9_RIDPI|nr:hypothetical protein NP493_1748g00001 [Ridgeia piscesae]
MSHEAYLRNSLAKYQHPDIAKRDILNVFNSYKDLRPVLDTFVFNDGTRKELLCLDGTVPVPYKGNTYNIPICLWLMDTHPYNPPMVFVKPTSTMMLKTGRHIDGTGRVYLPYLHEWKHPQADLLGLFQVLIIVFGEDPPVYSKVAAPPRPAYPPTTHDGNTPYPAAGGGMPVAYPPSTTSGYPSQQTPSTYTGGGAYPPKNQWYGGSQPQGYPYQAQSYPPYPSTQSYTAQTGAQTSGVQITEEDIRVSLLSAVKDKLRRRAQEVSSQSHAELETLRRTQDDLNKGKTTLEQMLQRLEREQSDVERTIMMLQEKDDEIQQVIHKMETRGEVNVDEAVVPTAPLYKQLLNTFAEEQAIEDALYYLSDALQRGVIDIEQFLKKVRELSRKQYMLRALIQKCRQKAGLPEI